MTPRNRYPIGDVIRQVSAMLQIAPQRVLHRAGLPVEVMTKHHRGVTAAQYFAVWVAIADEAQRPDLAVFLGTSFAKGLFSPPIFAFSCSPNLEKGLDRLALFKPLLGPIRIALLRQDDALQVTFSSAEVGAELPADMGLMELVYFVESVRIFSATRIVPLAAGLTGPLYTGLADFFGVDPHTATDPMLVFSLEDAHRPFVTENEAFWREFEPGLRRKLLDADVSTSLKDRVRAALLEGLPGGRTTAAAMCDRLHLSKRSLQRRLAKEDTSFQQLLEETRADLSKHYIENTTLSVPEMTLLLGFRDPSSFFRAFQTWTGKTPMEARSAARLL